MMSLQSTSSFKQCIMLIVDNNDADQVKEIMMNDIEQSSGRHEGIAGMYDKGSAVAPAFGMVGTLVGLINMLKSTGRPAGTHLKNAENRLRREALPLRRPSRVRPGGPGGRKEAGYDRPDKTKQRKVPGQSQSPPCIIPMTMMRNAPTTPIMYVIFIGKNHTHFYSRRRFFLNPATQAWAACRNPSE